MRITQVMIRDLACLEGNATVADAARLMKEKDIGAVLITDSGKLVGIVTERDLALKVLAEGRGGDVPITEIYTPNPETAREGASVAECIVLLRDAHFRHLPIVDLEKRPVGIVSTRDFYKKLAEGMDRIFEETGFSLQIAEGEDPYTVILGPSV